MPRTSMWLMVGVLAMAPVPASAVRIKEYRLSYQGTHDWSDARTLGPTLTEVKKRLQQLGGPYRIRVRGETPWSQKRTLEGTMERVQARLRAGRVGDMVLVESPRRVLRIRIVLRRAKVPPTPGTPKVDSLHGALWKRFPDLESWGICNCRHIADSSTWSQHAWCNAEDLRRVVGGSVRKGLDPVYRWLKANQRKYHLEHILWQIPDHYDHIHVDMKPNRNGTPPCAR